MASQKVYGMSAQQPHGHLVEGHMDDIQSSWSASTWFWIIAVPIIVLVLLMVLMPTFVEMSKTNGDDNGRFNPASLLMWTLIITLIVWVLFWGFSKCKTC